MLTFQILSRVSPTQHPHTIFSIHRYRIIYLASSSPVSLVRTHSNNIESSADMIGNPLKWAIGGGGERDDPNDPSHNKKSFKNQQLSDKSDIRKAEQEDKKSDKKGVDGNKKSGKTWPRGILKSTGEGSSDEGQSIPLDKFRAAASEGGAKEVGKQPSSRSADLTTCTTMLPSAIKDEIGPMGAMINSQRRRTSAESGSLIGKRSGVGSHHPTQYLH
jgi:hypothetical protein